MATMDVPDILQAKNTLLAKSLGVFEHPLFLTAQRLLCISDYAGRQLSHLKTLLEEDDCQSKLIKEDYQRLSAQITLDSPPNIFARSLRHFRHRHLLRLLLRELANVADTKETMSSWSDCADAIILHTIRYCEGQLIPRMANHATLQVKKQSFTS